LKSRLGSDLIELEVAPAELEPVIAVLSDVGCGPPTVDRGRARISIPVCDPVADLMTALRTLDEANITPRDLGLRRPSLDDVFLTLTGRPIAEDGADAPKTAVRREPRAARTPA
jgi:ABC-2 type transport system ATP-binding protein